MSHTGHYKCRCSGAINHVLSRVEASHRQTTCANRSKGNLLQTRESTLPLVRMVSAWIQKGSLQRCPAMIASLPCFDDVLQLIDATLRAAVTTV